MPTRKGVLVVDSEPRVVVTGIGVISSIGIGRDDFVTALRAGACGAAPISGFDTTGFRFARAYEVPDFDPAASLRRIEPGSFGKVGAQAAGERRDHDVGRGLGRVVGARVAHRLAAEKEPEHRTG